MGDRAKPRTVREILLEMKNASELAVSLSYAALMYGDKEIAEEVLELEDKLDRLRYELAVRTILAGRSLEDARELAAILEVGIAVDSISDAVGDLAKLVKKGVPLHPSIVRALEEFGEIVAVVRVARGSPIAGMRARDLYHPSRLAGCDLLAVKREGRWIFDYPDDLVVREGDVLLLEGTEEGIRAVRELAAAPPRPSLRELRGAPKSTGETSRLAEYILGLRSLSELMVYLAYASLLLNNRVIAYEVSRLEDELDGLHESFQRYVLSVMPGESSPDEMILLLQAGTAAESIGDAAHRMASLVEMGVSAHPVLNEVVEESDETIVRVEIPEGSPAVGREIGELDLEEYAGMEVLAVRRGVRWIYDPKDSFKLRAGDLVLLLGSPYGEEEARRILGAEAE